MVNIPFLGALAGCSARRSEHRVASHTSEEQRRNAPARAAKNGILAFSASLIYQRCLRHDWHRRSTRSARLAAPAFDEPSLLLKAVLTGQGAGLLPAAIAALDHSQGRHVKLADVSWSKAFAYYLVYPQASHELPKVATFATGFSTWPATLPKQQPESTGSLQRQCDIQEPFRAQSSRLMNCAELRHCSAASAEPMPTFGRTAFSRM